MASVKPGEASRAYHIFGLPNKRTQAEKKRLEAEREALRAAEVMEWHEAQRRRVRAQPRWRLPEIGGLDV